ncbi:MAG TPA: bifunctional demethylmenaquinone methyltransferase/2-methoxy-6-polyprenyl-1,4-benzoquinol methylase UbiE [Candidatus Polarisedimenticolia bacterium]|nr:bifunctional demethylmenaquinone methyltransferase/2-methoxy-6-polyprenyl-1,4-benzoquinol methylase UbiE [Candidatus Polarisedimenticolia bacterium]
MRADQTVSKNRYAAPGGERPERVRDLFSRIARRYDLINDLMSWGMHRRWKRRLVDRARVRPGDRGLDLCCGTGDVTRALARAASDGTKPRVVGLDFTAEMLVIARRSTPESLPIRFQQGDALRLPFQEGEFQILTVAYGLRNLGDLDRGLREALRVLAPGGRLVSLEFGRPRNRLLGALYFAYLRAALPLFGLLFFRDPQTYGYIYATVSRFPGQRELAERMRAAGFAPVEVHDLMGGIMGICVATKPGDADLPGRAGS